MPNFFSSHQPVLVLIVIALLGVASAASAADVLAGAPQISHEIALPAVSVEAESLFANQAPYYIGTGAAATKTDSRQLEIPVSVQVVERELMDDQQVISLSDALKNVSGVQVGGYSYYDNFIIRGFDAGQSTYRNGVRQAYISNLETANLDRIEVLKGPAAILYGRIEPGGMVNLIAKRPQKTPHVSVQQQTGSYDLYRTTIDSTGPLVNDHSWLYRVNLAYKDANSFRDYVHSENVFIAPSLTWRPNLRFETNLTLEYQRDSWVEDGSDNGIPALGNRPAPIPISRYLGDAAYSRQYPSRQNKLLLAMDWRLQLNPNWNLTNRFQYLNTQYRQHILWSDGLGEDQRNIDRGLWHLPFDRHSYGTNIDLNGKFRTAFMQHDVLLGFDLYRYDARPVSGFAFSGYDDAVTPIDIYKPRYGLDLSGLMAGASRYPATQEFNDWYALYFHDHITLWENWHLLAGGRQDWTEYGHDFNQPGHVEITRTSYFSPRVGVLYQPMDWVALYGNYVDALGLNNSGRSLSGPLPPEQADQFEAGIKTELLHGQLNATFAYFQISKRNVAATDAENPLYSKAIGKVRSEGMELDLVGKLNENLQLIASYAYTDARIVSGGGILPGNDVYAVNTPGIAGNRLASVPRHSGSLWAQFQTNDGSHGGLSLGSGVYLRSDRQGDNENSFQLPGYIRWDASIGYRFRQYRLNITPQLNVFNILDKTYYDHSSYRGNIRPGDPISFLGSIRIDY